MFCRPNSYRAHAKEMPNYKRKFSNYNKNDSGKKPRYSGEYEIIQRVRSQEGIRGELVLFHSSVELPFTILHNAVDRINGSIDICNLDRGLPKTEFRFELSINNEVIAQGSYVSEPIAKKYLAELAVAHLKKTCFTIFRKIQPRDTPKVDLTPASSTDNAPPQTSKALPHTSSTSVGGIGAKMMLQMGWSGKGLGAQEQGRTDIVQPYIQIQRQGLGTKNITQEVRSVLEKYAASKDLNSIAFSPEFTKEERVVIHEVARKLHLVSRSYGQGSDRMLVVRSKIKPWDLIYSLLEAGGETEQLKLILPTEFGK